MAETIRANIGSKAPKYLPASGDKKQALYVDVAENRSRFDREQQQWVDLPTRWYEAKFQGRDADIVRDQLEQGDALILIGTKEHHVFEKADGTKHKSTKFYVDSFGIDPHRNTFTIDRTPRPGTVREQAQTAERVAAGEEIKNRLRQLVDGRVLSPDAADRVMITFTSGSEEPASLAQELENTLVLDQAPKEARLFVVSVAEQYAGNGVALDWQQSVAAANELHQAQQAQQLQQTQQATPAPWPAVSQIRNELHSTAPAGLRM
ncbi:single-stranded DNA-binding protein [Leucobacter musarum]|uniref:single-stranded DNA-binding protein n=1 Tax=Leucobacter musarum TaxID=1930747 RepID=UPI0006A79173|nr:single-stranded DNA-binding protein [Leucobacter musarum]